MTKKKKEFKINNSQSLLTEFDNVLRNILNEKDINTDYSSLEKLVNSMSRLEFKSIYDLLPKAYSFYELTGVNGKGKRESFYFVAKEPKKDIEIKLMILMDRGNEVLIDYELLTIELFYLLSYSIEMLAIENIDRQIRKNILAYKKLIKLDIDSIIDNFDFEKEYDDFYSYEVDKYLKSISRVNEKSNE